MQPGGGNGVANYAYYRECFGDPETVLERDVNPEVLIRKLKAAGKEIPGIYMACGTEDFLLASNRKMRDFLQSEGADLRYEEGPGIHDWNFWGHRCTEGVEWLLSRQS